MRRRFVRPLFAAVAPVVLAGCSGTTASATPSTPAATAVAAVPAASSESSSAGPRLSAAACAAIEPAWAAFEPTMPAQPTFKTETRVYVQETTSLGSLEATVGDYLDYPLVHTFFSDLSDLGTRLTDVQNDLSGLGDITAAPQALARLSAAQHQAKSDEQAVSAACS